MTLIEGTGTPESVWLPYLDALSLPELTVQPAPARVVAVAPHPDDEVLGAGGLLALLAGRGVPVVVVAVTDGEASHPGSRVVTPSRLAALRVAETANALVALGIPAPALRLRAPDGGAQSLQAPTLAALHGLVLGEGDWLVAPWSRDGHPDHEAVGRAAEQAARESGARLLAYPVWFWHWGRPDDAGSPWDAACRVTLPDKVREAKAAALRLFRSQVEPLSGAPEDAPILPAAVLARFTRPYEVVFA